MKKLLITSSVVIGLLAMATPVLASTFNGTLTTGVSTGLSGIVDAVPTANPVAGTYTAAQSVTLTAADADSIHFTADGTSPNCTTGTTYTGAIAVSASETIRAVACYSGAASAVGTFAYGINITPPAPASSSGGGGGGGGGGIVPAPTSSTSPADFNHDGKVDIADFNALVVAWGTTGPNLAADLNHDGVVDLLDFNLLIVNWTG